MKEVIIMSQDKKIILDPLFRDVVDFACTIYQSDVIKKKKDIFIHPIEQKYFYDLLDKLEYDADVILDKNEMLFIFMLLDHSNNLLLLNTPPYSEVEMDFFSNSEQFFAKYNISRDKDFKSKWFKYRSTLQPPEKDK
jgi:hypothetical protein